jgi:hypothetical protein
MGSGLGRQMGIGRLRRREQVGLGLGNGMGRLSTVCAAELGREEWASPRLAVIVRHVCTRKGPILTDFLI